MTGPRTVEICEQIFSPRISNKTNGLITGSIAVDDELRVDAKLYMTFGPSSYTGDDVAEIHIHTNASVTEALMRDLLGQRFGAPLRMAGPGEFTARAYLNGKIDLAQAEAVNEVVVSSNKFQLDAAEKLLSGRLAEATSKVRSAMMDCLSLIEAGLDFSGEDIEFITRSEAIRALAGIKKELEQLLSASISYESVIDLPAVGIAGAPNAGKSSLLNKLLGKARSIVSHERRTTRDVLTGLLTLAHCRCVLFDCAGLTRCSMLDARDSILDELAQQAAIEALRNSFVVLFCVDLSKEDWSEDFSIRQLVEPQVLIPVATKADLLSEEILANRLVGLNNLFAAEFLPTSAVTGVGLEQLRDRIDKKLIELVVGSGSEGQVAERASGVALTARHRQAVTEAIESVSSAINESKAGNDEVTAMMLRAAYQAISDIEQQHIDERILDRIFSRFCIGK
ncbi:MAG: hypothetical protein AMJ43_11300 [Coxiella sp. DG_40]|nr:MAG: hypothetical protein AMJ43_11300 [Coxiella sp. DG_40]